MLSAGRCAPLLAVLLSACEAEVGAPQRLWLLWLVPALALFHVYVQRAQAGALARLVSPALAARLAPGARGGRRVFKAVLVIAGFAAAALALAQLRYGYVWEEVKRRGVDVVVALDVSDSMLVQDVETDGSLTRLERAKREIVDLLRRMRGDRVALVAFAGAAFVQTPLTLDYGAARLFLDELGPDLIPLKGTAIGEAIRRSLEAFEGGSEEARAVILITDGEDHSGDAVAAAEEAKKAGVRVFTIGIGRDEGAPIPAPAGGFRRDARGELVLSKLDEATLQRVAEISGGSYVRSVTGDVDLERIYVEGIKGALEDEDLGATRQRRSKDRFQWLVALAALALAIEAVVGERGRASGVQT